MIRKNDPNETFVPPAIRAMRVAWTELTLVKQFQQIDPSIRSSQDIKVVLWCLVRFIRMIDWTK